MKINTVKPAFKIADVELVPNSTKLNFNYLNDLKDENGQKLPQSILRENYARVYIIVVDGEIKKIGGSQSAGGIKQTFVIKNCSGEKRSGESEGGQKFLPPHPLPFCPPERPG